MKNDNLWIPDERYKFIQLKAFKSAFVSFVIYIFVNSFLVDIDVIWCEPIYNTLIGLCFSMLIYKMITIYNDAYVFEHKYNLSVKTSIFIIEVFLVLVVLLLIIGDIALDGMLTYRGVLLVIISMFTFENAVFIRRKTKTDKDDNSDDDE